MESNILESTMLEGDMVYLTGVIGLVVGWYLITRSWMWFIASVVGILASFYAILASIFHFEILAALGYTAALVLCLCVAFASSDRFLVRYQYSGATRLSRA
jgi:hypothetical protein|tara:strand:- start:2171 stop:2473 length:303 start_codon:yes stop_codon:yes gene_type:complete